MYKYVAMSNDHFEFEPYVVETHIDVILGCSYKNIQYSNEIRRLTCRAVERQQAVMRLNDMRDGSNRVKKLREELSEQALSLTKN